MPWRTRLPRGKPGPGRFGGRCVLLGLALLFALLGLALGGCETSATRPPGESADAAEESATAEEEAAGEEPGEASEDGAGETADEGGAEEAEDAMEVQDPFEDREDSEPDEEDGPEPDEEAPPESDEEEQWEPPEREEWEAPWTPEWDVELPEGTEPVVVSRLPAGPLSHLAFAPDGSFLAAATSVWPSTSLWPLVGDGTGRLLEGGDGAVAVSPDGRWLVNSTGMAGEANVWDTGTWTRVRTLSGCRDLTFSPITGQLACWDLHASKIVLWSRAWEREGELDAAPLEVVATIRYSPDGGYIVAGGFRNEPTPNPACFPGVILVWRVGDGDVLAYPPIEPGCDVIGLAISPDSRWVAAGLGGDGDVHVWKLADGTFAYYLGWRSAGIGHSFGILNVEFALDGRWVASAGGDGAVMIWSVATGGWLHTFADGHGDAYAMALAPSGRYLAAGYLDSILLLWDVSWIRE